MSATSTPVRTAPQIIPGIKPRLRRLHQPILMLNQFRDMVAMLEHRYRTYGAFSSRYLEFSEGKWGHLMLFGAEYNRLVLSDGDLFHVFGVDTFGDAGLDQISRALLFQNGDIHRENRRLMMPAFHKNVIQTYRDEMVEIIDTYLSTLRVGEELDINRDMHHLTMQIASRTLFGVDVRDQDDSIGELIAHAFKVGMNPLVFLLPVNRPGFPRYQHIQNGRLLAERIHEIIERKRAEPEGKQDALSILLRATDEDGGRMSDDELVGQVHLLFVAGHETSANALTFTLLLLSQHPHIMATLVDELQAVLGLNGDAPTIEQLGRLPLLDAVIKESMRLFPPAAMMNRMATAPFSLNGYEFGQYTAVTISPYITHRMPELYAHPRRFDPSRWENIQPGPYEYFPFGAGSRMCIGAQFALMEIKLVLAMLLSRYRLTLMPKGRIKRTLTITLGVDGALPMTVHPQDREFSRSKTTFSGKVRQMVDWA